MADFPSGIQHAVVVFGGSLVEGDHDTISLLGAKPQSDLKRISKKVSSLAFVDDGDIDKLISAIPNSKMMPEENATQNFFRKIRQKSHRLISSEPLSALPEGSDPEAILVLRQKQLIKRIRLMEKMSETLLSCSVDLERCINEGGRLVGDWVLLNEGEGGAESDADLNNWYERLSRRLGDLRISHTVSLQTQAQLKLLQNNYRMAFDRVSSAISNLSTITEAQIAIETEMNLLERRC